MVYVASKIGDRFVLRIPAKIDNPEWRVWKPWVPRKVWQDVSQPFIAIAETNGGYCYKPGMIMPDGTVIDSLPISANKGKQVA
jgi:hypothetical protein